MTTTLIVIMGFGWGVVRTFSKAGRKHEREQAEALLAQVPKGAFGVLLMVFAAFRLQDPPEANRRVESYLAETDALLDVLRSPRDPELSAGQAADRLNLNVWTTGLRERGYSERAATVIACAFHHHLETPLDEVIQSRRWEASH